ncbi:helix-turn-helix transcriptional regulator [Nitriliruptoraceae bacterium ZYF776]|nr:helix-turn-helix transcriptional regulator [Profundirhabdus halotolerans]
MSSEAAPVPDPHRGEDGAVPLTRAQRQQRTRRALIDAARVAFGRDGYHGANLTAIAAEAGYSKGAVYSNFASKAELFLAVMDLDLDRLRAGGFDPLATNEAIDARQTEILGEIRGFALATLEFTAAALRDEELGTEFRQRIAVLLTAYHGFATEHRTDDEQLELEQLALLLVALDQGMALLTVSGLPVDTALLRAGLRRLVSPPPP